MMDEAALVQKDLSLAQKGVQPTAEIDRETVAQHLSEALSLQYLAKSNDAKLEQLTRLLDEFQPMNEEILAATATYKGSKHSEADFETWYDAVSEGFGKFVGSVGSEAKSADADMAKAREELDFLWDRMEEAGAYGDKLTNLEVATQRSSQARMLSGFLTEQNDSLLKNMEDYGEKTKDGFKNEKFGKIFASIQIVLGGAKSNLETFLAITKQKIQEVKDAKLKFQSRSGEEINKGLWQLLAMDKSKHRTEIAQHTQFGFMPREGEYTNAITVFSQSKRTEADSKALRGGIFDVLKKTEDMVKALNEVDAKAEKEAKDVVIASFANLADEAEFVKKLLKFSTHWGRQRLETDLLNEIHVEQGAMFGAFDEYEKSSEPEKAFGKLYTQLMRTLVTLKTTFSKWAEISALKESQMKEDNLQLNAWMKQ